LNTDLDRHKCCTIVERGNYWQLPEERSNGGAG
jgi:hypothetical protein